MSPFPASPQVAVLQADLPGGRLRLQRRSATAAACLAGCLLLLPGAGPRAATLRWTGLSGTVLWSDAANWDALRVPANGDDLVFGGGSAQSSSIFDLTLSFASLAFAANAQPFALHVQGSGAAMSFNGAGIRNLTGSGGPIRQDVFADAGTAGGSIVFSGFSGINLGGAVSFRPVNLTALGAGTATAIGGHIVFQDDASTSPDTFDALRAEGAAALGGVGGEIRFLGNAVATRTAAVTVTGGTVLGALGAQANFAGLSRADAIVNVLAGEGGGLGARADFTGRAVASVYATLNIRGAASATVGAQAVATFRDDTVVAGSVNTEAGAGAGFAGGQIEFRDRASHDTSGIDPSLGTVQIRNGGSTVAGARGGSTVFRDDAAVRGARLFITNAVQSEGADAGSASGTTEFRDRAQAGQLTVVNQGAAASGAAGGSLLFADDSTAGNAAVRNTSATVANAVGGTAQFLGRATAAGASIVNEGALATGAFGGSASFSSASSAGSATIVNAAGQTAGTVGGATRFTGAALAGSAYIANNTGTFVGGGGGSTVFMDDASAQRATIDNQGGLLTTDNASTRFRDRASAGQAAIFNFGGRAASAFGGGTSFDGRATAAQATLVMAGGGTDRALGGSAVFQADADAGSATLDVRAASVFGAVGGRALFFERASASSARISVAGSPVNHVLGSEGAAVSFAGTSSAGDAVFTVGGNSFAGGGVGSVRFNGASTAARSTLALAAGRTRGGALVFEGAGVLDVATAGAARITNQASSAVALQGTAIGGQTTFAAFSTAGNATVSNEAGYGPGYTAFFAASTAGDASFLNLGGAAGETGGTVQFNNTASAERAVIVNRAGARGASGFDAAGLTRFVDQASAGQARITAEGASAGAAVGGLISFSGNADPARATLVAEGGTGGGSGGRILLAGLVNASVVRVILNAGAGTGAAGELDVSGVSTPRVAIGSVEGGGIVSLGSRNLTLWSPGSITTFSGLVRDGGVAGGGGGVGGSLSVSGGARLTLTGANTYSGGTRIGDGVNAGSGKLAAANTSGSATGTGDVVVESGGTLGGSGFIAGRVTLMPGGIIAPGDPVTLTLGDSLTWNGGGVIRLALGADSAGSDHLVMHSLVRGTGGAFLIDLVDFGMTAGATYDLLRFDSSVGFSASDFSFSGLAGSFDLRNGTLEFTTTAVPEPGTAALWLLGLLVVVGVRRQHLPAAFTKADARTARAFAPAL